MSVEWVWAVVFLADVSPPCPPASDDRLAAALLDRLPAADPAEQTRILLRIRELKLVQALPVLVLMKLEEQVGAKLDVLRAHSLGMPDPNELFDELVEACSNFSRMEGSPLVRGGCSLGCDAAFWQAQRWLDHSNPAVSYFAAAWMIRLRIPSELIRIRRRVECAPLSTYPWLRPLARAARLEWSEPSIREGLRQGDRWSVIAAASSRDPQWFESMVRLAGDPDQDRREDLVWALGELRCKKAIPFLLLELKGGETAVAAEALGKIGDASVLPDLVRCLEGSTLSRHQADIIGALGELGSRKELPLLERFADSKETTGAINVSRAAKHAMANIKRRFP